MTPEPETAGEFANLSASGTYPVVETGTANARYRTLRGIVRVPIKHLMYALARHEGASAADAKKEAGYAPATIKAGGFNLDGNVGVRLVLDDLEERKALNASVSADHSLLVLAEIRDAALAKGKISEAARCEELRGRIGGLYVERKEMLVTQRLDDRAIALALAKITGREPDEALKWIRSSTAPAMTRTQGRKKLAKLSN